MRNAEETSTEPSETNTDRSSDDGHDNLHSPAGLDGGQLFGRQDDDEETDDDDHDEDDDDDDDDDVAAPPSFMHEAEDPHSYHQMMAYIRRLMRRSRGLIDEDDMQHFDAEDRGPPIPRVAIHELREESQEESSGGTCLRGPARAAGGLLRSPLFRKTSRSSSSLKYLPIDALTEIFQYVPPVDILRNCSRVSHWMQQLSHSQVLWKSIAMREVPELAESLIQLVAARGGAGPSQPARYLDPSSSAPLVKDVKKDQKPPTAAAAPAALPSVPVTGALNPWVARFLLTVPMTGASPAARSAPVACAIDWPKAYRYLPQSARICIADQRNGRVLDLRLDGTLERVLPSNQARLIMPSGVTLVGGKLLAVSEFGEASVAVIEVTTGHLVRRFRCGHNPRGLAALGQDEEVVVCEYGNATVSVYSIHTGQRDRVLGTDWSGPSGVVVCPPGDRIAVSENHGNCVKVLCSRTGNMIAILGQQVASPLRFSSPRGMCLHPDGDSLVVCDGSDTLICCRFDGSVRRIYGGPFDCPASVMVAPDKRHFIVSDCDHHRLLVVRIADGKMVSQISGDDDDDNMLRHPRCICVLPFS